MLLELAGDPATAGAAVATWHETCWFSSGSVARPSMQIDGFIGVKTKEVTPCWFQVWRSWPLSGSSRRDAPAGRSSLSRSRRRSGVPAVTGSSLRGGGTPSNPKGWRVSNGPTESGPPFRRAWIRPARDSMSRQVFAHVPENPLCNCPLGPASLVPGPARAHGGSFFGSLQLPVPHTSRARRVHRECRWHALSLGRAEHLNLINNRGERPCTLANVTS